MTRMMFLCIAALLLGACVGTLEPVGDDTSTGDDDTTSGIARSMFDTDVSPMLGASCAGCHAGTATTAPKFLGAGGATGYYAAITAQVSVTGNFVPANASLLNKGSHNGGLGPAWTQTEKDTITEWLLAEASER